MTTANNLSAVATTLEEDARNNQRQQAQRNNVVLTGKRGRDNYIINKEGNTGIEIIINNDGNTPLDDLSVAFAQDTLQLQFPIEQIHLHKQGDDIIFSHRSSPEQYPRIRLLNFMAHERYRHLSIMDENSRLYDLVVDAEDHVLLMQRQINNGDNNLILHNTTATTGISLHAGPGHDTIIDKSGGSNTLHGDDGNDMLLAWSGNNALFGGAGNDRLVGGTGHDVLCGETGNDTLVGNAGNDIMVGGVGDDIYLFARGDGHDSILEDGGTDSLVFTSREITRETLWLKKDGDNLRIQVNGANSGDTVTVLGYYDNPKNKIEMISVERYQLAGDNIDRMVEAMSTFTSSESISAAGNINLQTHINSLWIATSNP
ncbi:calcium-binding protein [Candidatus Fukatsuia symbiotica]|nr:calcium-binding protein [Candidatus Fukatsuia symbiotica]MEA9444293.1 calcium-binding protein [Candidatus Fukatsuia symbiotica]